MARDACINRLVVAGSRRNVATPEGRWGGVEGGLTCPSFCQAKRILISGDGERSEGRHARSDRDPHWRCPRRTEAAKHDPHIEITPRPRGLQNHLSVPRGEPVAATSQFLWAEETGSIARDEKLPVQACPNPCLEPAKRSRIQRKRKQDEQDGPMRHCRKARHETCIDEQVVLRRQLA